MSLTSRERGNPPPRRKSCAACIKAKRRCDAATPACMRCQQRHIPCEYPARRRLAPLSDSPTTIEPSLLDKSIGADIMTVDDSAGSKDPLLTFCVPDTEALDVLPLSFDFDFNEMHLIHHSSPLAPPTSTKDHDAIAETIANRLQWAIDETKRAPYYMITHTQTPWCHPQLYASGMPTSIRNAHVCCALYIAKNPVNGPVILRSIEAHVQDLQEAPPPSTPLEFLAHTQAMILYQIIRLFDGDITARASAERHSPVLEASAMSLLAHVNFDVGISSVAEMELYPIEPIKGIWRDWVFQESARRTVLFAFLFAQIYRLISGQKGLQCDGRLGLCHSWTMSQHLWQARTPVEFAKACRDKKYFVVTDAQFGTVLQEAQAEDVDCFGRMLISTLLGVHEAEGWFAARGGSLDIA